MTRNDVARLIEGLAVRGNCLIVHSSLSSFGEVDGGATTVCTALMDAVGDGTIVMPAFTYVETLSATGNRMGEDSGWSGKRPVAFHPDLPVSSEIGAIPEAFRRLPGVMRSNHPTHSFMAWGRQAREVLSTQRDNNPLGPLKKLNVLQGQVVLLGTTLQAATAVHLAEEQLHMPYLSRRTALRVNTAGYDERVVLENVPGCSFAFIKIEDRLEPLKVRSVQLPRGTGRKIPIRYLVTLAAQMLEADPQVFVCDRSECASCAAKRHTLVGTSPSV